MKKWLSEHQNLKEFILFNLLANCATLTNFLVMWLCTGVIFKGISDKPFKFLFFDYSTPESLMLCGFLSFLIATTAAQIVNYIVQKNLVFKSDASFEEAIPKYVVMVIVLVIVSTVLPGYSQKFFMSIGVLEKLAPTLANMCNILIQVVISYPSMKFWIMPKKKETVIKEKIIG